MSISALRQLWILVERMQASTLLRLSDAELVQQLLTHIEGEAWLNRDDLPSISIYIQSKLPLIRDLAQARLA